MSEKLIQYYLISLQIIGRNLDSKIQFINYFENWCEKKLLNEIKIINSNAPPQTMFLGMMNWKRLIDLKLTKIFVGYI